MIELRKLLKSYLISIHPRVYFQDAPKEAAYPYIVYDIAAFSPDGECLDFVEVDIDGWDRPNQGDTTELEMLMAAVNGNGDIFRPTGLDKQTLTTEKIIVSFYLENKLPLSDPDDKRIRRRKYTYQARLFKKE